MQFIIDNVADELLEGELRVLLFITRQTAGWGKVRDVISVSQIAHGIKNRRGTGMTKRAVIRSYQSLEARGLIHIMRPDCKKGNLPLTFELTLPVGQQGRPKSSTRIAMQTRMTPLEKEETAVAPGRQPHVTLAVVDGRGGVPETPPRKPKVVSQRRQGGVLREPGWCPKGARVVF
jgi:hypothetical protein